MALDPITGLEELGTTLITHLFPDPAQAAQAALKLAELKQSGALAGMFAQTATNKVEAANPNWFVSGWRPYIGWICGTGLAYQFLAFPVMVGFFPQIRAIDTWALMQLLFGMLGLAGLRSKEKIEGVAAK